MKPAANRGREAESAIRTGSELSMLRGSHFFSHGFRSVTMDDLAEELGISKKTLYAHFPGKFDLLEAVLAAKFAAVEATLKQVTRSHPQRFPGDFARVVSQYASRTG